MKCTNSKILTLLLILAFSCKPDNELITKTEDRYEIVDGKQEIVEQVVQRLRRTDNKPISRLTKIFNHDNDIRIEQLTVTLAFSKLTDLKSKERREMNS